MIDQRVLDDYRRLMDDKVRMAAYDSAIRSVCPGKLVCDIGTGLGPLSLMALNAGAEHVYGIGADKTILSMATKVIRESGFGPERFTPVPGLSQHAVLPRQVDVLVSETLDSNGIGENTAFILNDARKRFLTSDGIVIPSRLTCYAALSKPAQYSHAQHFWSHEMHHLYGMNFASVGQSERSNNQRIHILPHEINSEFKPWFTVRFDGDRMYTRQDSVWLTANSFSQVDGVCMVFDATLTDGISLRNFPSDPLTHWLQGFSAFREPLRVDVGDRLRVHIQVPDTDLPYMNVSSHGVLVKRTSNAPSPGSGLQAE